MTPIPSDYLAFRVPGEGMIPCGEGPVSFQLEGEALSLVDADLVRHAAAAVLHYYRQELKRSHVSRAEFAAALEVVLHGFGLTHLSADLCQQQGQHAPAPAVSDLRQLVGEGLELAFFPRLREELRRQLQPAPALVRFHGLRGCVLQLAGSRRWSRRCQSLRDQIVEFLRTSLQAEPVAQRCGLVVH
jgi:hypothetical protein